MKTYRLSEGVQRRQRRNSNLGMGMGLGQNKNPDPEWNELRDSRESRGEHFESRDLSRSQGGLQWGTGEKPVPRWGFETCPQNSAPCSWGHTQIHTTSSSLVNEEAHERAGCGH